MDKKILLVEKSQAVRNIAESLLRQNGFEVLSADCHDAAREILHGSKIDLILTGSDITDSEGRCFYEILSEDDKTAGIPFLILHDAAQGDIGYPPESIINKPFTPRDFLNAIIGFTGGNLENTPVANQEPFSGNDIEDDIIDAALGLDQVEVDESEVLSEDSEVYRRSNKKQVKEELIGYQARVDANDTGQVGKKEIEQIRVPEEDKAPENAPDDNSEQKDFLGEDSGQLKRTSVDDMSASSKIEIVPDQYGITSLDDQSDFEPAQELGGHDYDWFVREMQKEGTQPQATDSGKPLPKTGEENIDIRPAADNLNPVAPPPGSEQVRKEEVPAQNHGEAVDQFISEFKKEIAKITEEAIPNISVPENEAGLEKIEVTDTSSSGSLSWEDALEKFSPRDIKELAEGLIEATASKIAQQVIGRLDLEAVYRIIKDAIHEALDRAVNKERQNVTQK